MAPLRKATAHAVTETNTKRVILRHGCPESILSDNGTQFTSQEFTERLVVFNIQHRTTPAYAPYCNPTERANRTLKTMISRYVDQDHRTWDKNLPALQFAYNTAVQDATGYTPAFLNHGRELHVSLPIAPPGQLTTNPDSVKNGLNTAYELVRINLALGKWVWKRDHPLSNRAQQFNVKLAPKFIGPLEVRRIISLVIMDLHSRRGKWYRHVHIQDLKPAHGLDRNNENNENNEGHVNTEVEEKKENNNHTDTEEENSDDPAAKNKDDF
ncbi:uncharacterized protein LOC114943517 [Nylanderia fulva]|uniref:uncharacterized protein LOC114943517 n=1 Tax=Nylanderia fulva TaxID=613905 RepID=UPI0010FB05FA|nr:uncharacterized protein LOC114943517 [Nylanderia fulva]